MGTKHKLTIYSPPHTSKNDPEMHVTKREFVKNKQVGEAKHYYKGSDEYKTGEALGKVYKEYKEKNG